MIIYFRNTKTINVKSTKYGNKLVEHKILKSICGCVHPFAIIIVFLDKNIRQIEGIPKE